jgi:hypothetical protein
MYVSLKTNCKTVFRDEAKKPALAALEKAVLKAVDANSAFDTAKKDKVGIYLTATIVSLTANDKDNPTDLKLVVSVDGTLMGGSASGFKASGNGALNGVSMKTLPRDVADLVDAVVSDLMKNKVIPQMLKMKP